MPVQYSYKQSYVRPLRGEQVNMLGSCVTVKEILKKSKGIYETIAEIVLQQDLVWG